MQANKILAILAFVFFASIVFSLTTQPVSQQPIQNNESLEATHHSHPTVMSLQGKVEGLSSGDLRVKVSEQNSCSEGLIFDHNFSGAITESLFSLSLGTQYDLSLNYNQDYYLCLYVNGALVDGPSIFRGGQGQIDIEDVNTAGFATEFVPFAGATDALDMGSHNIQTSGNICLKDGCNAKIYYDSDTGDVVIDVE